MKIFTKNVLAAIFILAAFISKSQITWNGGGATNNFSEGANWVGGIAPGTADDVLFDGTSSKNCNFDMDIDVSSFTIASGYTGTVDALSTNPTIQGGFAIGAGTFRSTDQTLIIGGDLNFTGGTFTHNNGVVEIYIASGGTNVITGAWTFYNLSILSTGLSSVLRTMDFGASSTVSNILSLAGTTKVFSYKGTINVSNQLDILGTSTSTVVTGNTGTFNFNGASATINGAGAAARNKLCNITINTAGAVAISGHVSLIGSWKNTNIGSFTPGTSTLNFYGASGNINAGSTASTRAYLDNLAIQTGATLNVTAGSHIDLNGNFTHTGTYTGNTSLLMFTGGSAHTVGGTATLTTINAILKNGAGSLSFGHTINLLDSIKISGGAVTATNLVLKSTAALKARVAEISGGGSLSANPITVETFIPGGTTDWANLGASGVNGLSFNNWYGTIPMAIEGSPTDVTSAGGYFESVWRWSESDPSFYQYDSTVIVTDPINVGEGYWIYVGNGQFSTTAITTTVSGTPVTGAQSLPLSRTAGATQPGFCLLANPFASPISWDRIYTDDGLSTTGAIYIYNADFGGTSTYQGGVTLPGGSGAQSTIPMGQGFYVEANAGFGSINIDETHKVSNNTGANPLLKINPTPAAAVGSVIRLRIDDTYGYYDEAAIRFHSNATSSFDNGLDATKYWSSPGYLGYPGVYTQRTGISTQTGGKDYSINSLPLPLTVNAVIPVLAKVYASGQHTITGVDLNNLPAGTCVTLKDKLLNITHNLTTSPYVFSINDTTSVPRFELTVCANIVMGVNNATSVVNENVFVKQDANGVYVDLSFEKSNKAIISANNILGQQLMTPKQVECVSGKYYLDLNAKEQIIMVNVIANDKRTTKKIFIQNQN